MMMLRQQRAISSQVEVAGVFWLVANSDDLQRSSRAVRHGPFDQVADSEAEKRDSQWRQYRDAARNGVLWIDEVDFAIVR